MTPSSSSTKPTEKRSSQGAAEVDRVTNPDPLGEQPSQGADEEHSMNGKISCLRMFVAILGKILLSPSLLWLLGLSAGLIFVGSRLQDMSQTLEAMRWLIYRLGYPYFQAITLAALVVTISVVLVDVIKTPVNVEGLPLPLRLLWKLMLIIASGYKNNCLWTGLSLLSLTAFAASLSFPRCLSSDVVLVSFDIWDNGSLVRHLSPGETLVYAPARFIEIEAKLEANLFNLPPPRVTCEWVTHTGDGRLIQATNCKINYQTGSDERSDPVVVTITQHGCPSLGIRSVVVSKPE
jgi:hypothetical protein